MSVTSVHVHDSGFEIIRLDLVILKIVSGHSNWAQTLFKSLHGNAFGNVPSLYLVNKSVHLAIDQYFFDS